MPPPRSTPPGGDTATLPTEPRAIVAAPDVEEPDPARVDRAPRAPRTDPAPSEAGHELGLSGARWLASAALMSLGYLAAGKLGLALAIVHPSASAVWAPSGIALAAVILLGPRVWPGIFAAAFLVNITTAGSVLTSLGISAGNTLEALLAASLANRFARGARAFERAQDTFAFALLAGMLSTTVSATIGVTTLASAGFASWPAYRTIWLTWWLGDMGGNLVVTPVLLLWALGGPPRWSRAQFVEAGMLLLGTVLVGVVVFRGVFPAGFAGQPMKFLCMPLLVWTAFRFDPRTASAAVLALAVIAVGGTLAGARSLPGWEVNDSLVMLQVFMGVAAVTTLALAAVVAERRRVEQALLATTARLREAMFELEAFSHSITHDLRSPLGAVINYASLVEQDHGDRLGVDGARLLRRIRASALGAVDLLDQLGELDWVDRDRSELLELDMTRLVHDVYREIVASDEDAANIELELQPLPPLWGSAALLQCVFRNLLGNAVKYTRGRSERRIRVGGEASATEHRYWVADNGMGFDPSSAVALFQPFIRLPGAHAHEGVGLGLAIVAKIVRRHGGHAWAESDGTSGARFGFSVPRGERKLP